MDALEESLSNVESRISHDERIWFFIEKLYKGDIGIYIPIMLDLSFIEKRGFIDDQNVELLLSLFLERDKWTETLSLQEYDAHNTRIAAGKALTKYTFPGIIF